MKKIIPFLIYFLWLGFQSHSQSINWQWAVCPTNGSGEQEGYDLTTDSSGNVYIIGSFAGNSLSFGNNTLYNGGNINGFLAKYSSGGQAIWAVSPVISAGDIVSPIHIAIDGSANVYVTGSYSGNSVAFANIALPGTTSDYTNSFLAKYDSSGNPLWVQTAGGVGYAYGTGVATDAGDNIYLTGYFSSPSVSFDTFTLYNNQSNQSGSAVFVVKYDSTGQVLWAQGPTSVGGGSSAASRGIVTDLAGNAYVMGYYSNSLAFAGTTLHSVGSVNIFLAKYDSAGNVRWAKSAGVQNDLPYGIACDGSSHVYITGNFSSTYTLFDTITLNNPNPGGQRNALFITQYDTAGHVIWAKSGGAQLGTFGYGLATDACGNVYCTGGTLSRSITFDTSTFVVNGAASDVMYMVEYTAAGKLINGGLLGSGGDDQSGIRIDPNGNSYVVSDFESINPFVVAGDTLVLSGGETIYLAKFSCAGCTQGNLSYNVLPPSECQGNLTALYITGGSDITVSPLSGVYYADGRQFWLNPDTTTVFTISAYQNCGQFIKDSFTLPVFISSDIRITASRPGLCPRNWVQLCVPAGFSNYSWSTGDTTSCISVNSAGTYSVTVADNGLCSATCSQVIVSYSITPFSVSQRGDTLYYNYGSDYQWLLNGVAIAGATSSAYIAGNAGTYTLQITDSNGCTDVSDPLVITAINDITNAGVAVYPNPSAGSWHLSVDNNLLGSEASVFDAQGRQVFKTEIKTPQSEISFTATGGVYTLIINSSNVTVVRKLVKL